MRPTTPPVDRDRLIGRTHDVLLGVPFHARQILRDRPPGDRHAVAVQVTVVEQRLHQKRHAASFEQILGDIAAARFQIGDIWCPFEDLGDVKKVELDPAFMCDCWQMQAGIGRAAGGGDHGRRILQRLAGDDVARPDVGLDQLQDHLAGGGAELVAEFVRRGRAGRIRQREADRLGHRRHRVGGELGAAGAGRRAGDLLELVEILARHVADRMLADRLEHVLYRDRLAPEGAGQDRAAIDEDRRHVEADHRHHHAGQRLVAAREPDQARRRRGRASSARRYRR